MEQARKRGRPDAAFNGNGGFKRNKQEMETFTPGIGSKSKPCTKFFSTSGCPFGEGCHFLHYVPGGIAAVSQMTNLGGNQSHMQPSRNAVGPPPMTPDITSPTSAKSRICTKFNSAEGCKFGDKCYFSHGEREFRKAPSYEDPRSFVSSSHMMGRMPSRYEQQPPPQSLAAAASFGASATAKISVDSSLTGAIIGKGGVHSKQICRQTGVKLAIREHESDPNLKNIELEGTFDQIKQASALVRELIVNVAAATGPMKNHHQPHGAPVPAYGPGGNNFKTKMCDNFAKGSCTFGEKCHFAHGANELRKPGI